VVGWWYRVVQCGAWWVRGQQLELKGSEQKVSSAFNGDYKCTHIWQKKNKRKMKKRNY